MSLTLRELQKIADELWPQESGHKSRKSSSVKNLQKPSIKTFLPLLILITGIGMYLVFFGHAATVTCSKVASRTGSDSNAGTEASPYKTAQKVVDNLSSGDTGCLHAGVYNELANGGYVLRPLHGGTSTTSQITLRSYPNDPSGKATLQGPINFQLNSNYITLSDLNLDGSTYGSNSMEVYADHISLLRNDITNKHLGGSCIYLGSDGSYTATGPATNVLIKDNIIHACGKPANGNQDHSIYAHTVRNTDTSLTSNITENIFYDPTGFQIQFWTDSQGLKVDHNIFDGGSVRGGVIFGGGDNLLSNNNSVNNNIITNSAGAGLDYCWAGPAAANCSIGPPGTGNVANNNCLYNNAGGDISAPVGFTATGNLTATNPLYTNAATRDYTVSASSPCLAKTGYDIASAVNSAINSSGSSSDSTPPIVSLATPVSGATVSGSTLTVSASATDNVGVVGVQFKLDGANLSAEDTTSPYSVSWNTTTATNGSHTLVAIARDENGNTTTSTPVTVTVSNNTATLPTAPTGLVAVPGNNKVTLNWIANTATQNVTSYNIYRTGQTFAGAWGTVQSPTTTFTNSTNEDNSPLTNGTQYCYTLKAVNPAGEGPASTQVCVAPQATTSKPGDLNNDTKVDTTDLVIMLSKFGTTDANANLNGQGAVDTTDLIILLSKFGS